MNRQPFYISLIFVFLLSFILPLFALAQASSNAYKIQSDSINFAGGLSSSNSYGIESTAGESATGRLSSSNYGLHDAGYQQGPLSTAAASGGPINLVLTPIASDRIELQWDAPVDPTGVVGYYLYRNGTRINSVAAFPRDYIDSGLAPKTSYDYNVSAFDSLGNESVRSATSSATTFALPIPSSRTVFVTKLAIDPIISVVPNDTSALVTFETTGSVRATVSWGTTLSYSSGNISENTLSNTHRFVLRNLLPRTLYRLKITLLDGSNREIVYENIQFMTLGTPIIQTIPNVSNFSVSPSRTTNEMSLAWKLPADRGVYGVRIVRSTTFYPLTPTDGQVVFEDKEGKGLESFVDKNVSKGVVYYYTAFAYDLSKNFSSGVVGSGKISLAGEPAATSTPVDSLVEAAQVDPLIAKLQMGDFLFIQSGDSLPVQDDLVTVDGNKNLTIGLTYYRMPEILKTILVTLVTTDADPQSFSFILRTNKERTRFESTIGPLGKTKTYKIKFTVVDYKNQSQKRLQGTLISAEAGFSPQLEVGSTSILSKVGLLILLILCIALIKKFFGSKKKSTEPHA